MTDLEKLFEAAAAASPADRISFRDPIAGHGRDAIPRLVAWLRDPKLGAFAVRTLEKVGADQPDRAAVVHALSSTNLDGLIPAVAGDIADALARLRPTPRYSVGASSTTTPRAASWTYVDASAIEMRFHDDMLAIFRLAGEATRRIRADGSVARGYWASYFLRGVRNQGGLNYAHQLLAMAGTTEGFERLRQEGRLDLTMEALVLRPEYASLFSSVERQEAAHRLARAGYQPNHS